MLLITTNRWYYIFICLLIILGRLLYKWFLNYRSKTNKETSNTIKTSILQNEPNEYTEDASDKMWLDLLEKADLWAGLTPEQIKIKRKLFIIEEENNLWWYSDGEDIAEYGVEDWLRKMEPALRKCNVVLTIQTLTSYDDERYAIRINDEDIELYSSIDSCEDPWLDCTIKPIKKINELLASSNSTQRIMIINAGGNDGIALLLPFNVIKNELKNKYGYPLDTYCPIDTP